MKGLNTNNHHHLPHGGQGRDFCPSGRIDPQLLLLIIEGDISGDPALTKWSLGFDSWLVLGSPRVNAQQK